MCVCVCVCVCVCACACVRVSVCVCVSEREREGGRKWEMSVVSAGVLSMDELVIAVVLS